MVLEYHWLPRLVALTVYSLYLPPPLLTQDVSKCEKILEMKKIDFSRSLSIRGRPSDRWGTFFNFSHFLIPMDGLVTAADILS